MCRYPALSVQIFEVIPGELPNEEKVPHSTPGNIAMDHREAHKADGIYS